MDDFKLDKMRASIPQLLRDKNSICAWLEKKKIKNYELIACPIYGFIVNVGSSVCLRGDKNHWRLTHLKVKFKIINGSFDVSRNSLLTLLGSPEIVHGDFDCSNNFLTSLDSSPKTVKLNYDCSKNRLTSLFGAPHIVQDFNCSNNALTSLIGSPQSTKYYSCAKNNLLDLEGIASEVGDLDCSSNKINNLAFFPEKFSRLNALNNPLFEAVVDGVPVINSLADLRLIQQKHLLEKVVQKEHDEMNSSLKPVPTKSLLLKI